MLIFIIITLSILLLYFVYENFILKKKYKPLIDIDKYVRGKENEVEQTEKTISDLKNEVLKEKEKLKKLSSIKSTLEKEMNVLEEQDELHDFSFYNPKYFFDNSKEYKERLDSIYNIQKDMIKNKKAAICDTEWSVGNSKVQGRKMTNENLKLIIRAFNGEADAAIAKVKYNNISTMIKRIEKSKEVINKLGSTNRCFINENYFDLKIEELELTHEYREKLQEEKEEQQRIKEEMREEEKAIKEHEKAIKDAETEEIRNKKALEQAKKEYESSMFTKTEKEREKYSKKIEELEAKLLIAQTIRERAVSQAQLTKSGHVYIISNIGSFGESIYKIGMTRRLEPMDRVKELGDASVPFPFDVHAMIFSENAPELENKFHKEFRDKSVNLVNLKREFFEVTLEEIEKFAKLNLGEFKLTKVAIAEQFRVSEQIKKDRIILEQSEEENSIEKEIDLI